MTFFDLSVDAGVATLTLTLPTMPPPFFAAIEGAFGELAGRDEVRAIVVRSVGKGFSYGLDLPAAFAELGELFSPTAGAAARRDLLAVIRKWQGAFVAISRSPVPVIAAVHGWCIGGGLDLATACDLRLASSDARFSLRETRVAMVADLGSLQRLPRIVGQGNARRMAFTGEDVGAERALAMGLVEQVTDGRDALHAAADALARTIAAQSPLAVRGAKHLLDREVAPAVAEGLDYVATWNAAFIASEDLGEALAAFVEKRPPVYRGR